MEGSEGGSELATYAWRLAVTLFFVLLNAFFVAAEFALVKVRVTQVAALADAGSARARATLAILGRLDHYLSACQLGITIASLVLGWLAEPAVAELLLLGVGAAGLVVAPDDPVLHGVALALALAIVTTLHMTVGEQAPKLWAIQRSQSISLGVSQPLRAFAWLFSPFIWIVNGISHGLLRGVGLSADELHDATSHTADELKRVLSASAEAGHISPRQLDLARNVLDIMGLEVRHIMVPRVDVTFLSLRNSPEENLRIVQSSRHSRFPLCEVGLDSVVGVVHAKEVLSVVAEGREPDFKALARRATFVSDTQPVSRLLLQLQRSGSHSSVVVDEHGTAVGLAFLEDAIEEIVGPIRDEFDVAVPEVRRLPDGAIELPGSMPLPEAADLLDLAEAGDEADTIGGHVVALLGRLPRTGDSLEIGRYRVSVTSVIRRRIEWLRFEPRREPGEEAAQVSS